jgi:hypothetical protein
VGGRLVKGLQPQARGRAIFAPFAGRYVVAPDPFPGEGGPGPRGRSERANL